MAKLPTDEYIGHKLCEIADALRGMADDFHYRFGRLRSFDPSTRNDEINEEGRHQRIEQRAEAEIEELKKANKINLITARVAVAGVIVTAIFSALQYFRQPQPPIVQIQVSPETWDQLRKTAPSVTSGEFQVYPPSASPK